MFFLRTGGSWGRLFLFSLLCTGMVARPTDADEPASRERLRRDVHRAQALANQGEPENAIPLYSDLLNTFMMPPEAEARMRCDRGLMYFRSGQLDEAKKDWETALDLNPGFSAPRAYLSGWYEAQGQIDRAIDSISLALAREPNKVQWIQTRARLYALNGDWAAMRKDVECLSESDQQSPEIVRLWVEYDRSRGDDAQALKRLEQIPEWVARDLTLRVLRADLWLRTGLLNEAEQELARLLILHPENSQVLRLAGGLALRRGNDEKAKMIFSDLILSGEAHASDFSNRALIHAEHGDLDKALSDCREALALNPEWFEALLLRGQLLLRENAFGPALASLQRADAVRPDQVDTLLALAASYHREGLSAPALEYYSRVIELAPEQAWALGMRGSLYLQQSRFLEAQEDLDAALEIDPNWVFALRRKGDLFRATASDSQALEWYEKVLALERDPEILTVRAELLRSLGQDEAALAAYEEAAGASSDAVPTLMVLAEVYFEQGESQKALETIQQVFAATVDPPAEVYRLRAKIRQTGREWRLALDDLDEVEDVFAGEMDFHRERGDVLYALEEWEAAAEAYEQSIQVFRGNADAWLGLARTSWRREQWVQAEEQYETYRSIRPQDQGSSREIANALDAWKKAKERQDLYIR